MPEMNMSRILFGMHYFFILLYQKIIRIHRTPYRIFTWRWL